MGRPVTRGVLIKEEHVETLRRLPVKTMDAVVGAAFRFAIGEKGELAVKDATGILEALAQSIAVAAQKFDENEVERKAKDAERKRKERENKDRKAIMKMLEANSDGPGEGEEEESPQKGEMARGQRRTEADKGGQKRTEADRSGQKRTKTESAQKERKKEGRTVYNPLPLKGDGDEVLPPAVEAEDLIGNAAPGPEAESVPEAAKRMAKAHPNGSGADSFPSSLVRYLKKNGGGFRGAEGLNGKGRELLAQIVEAHGRWIESGAWDAEGGRYAPQLKNWLWGGDWKREPPEKKRARPAEDADDFHAGASL